MSADINEIYDRLLMQDYQDILFGDLDKYRRNGKQYTACCPFHEDSNPSFSISADKPLWNCFSKCGGGDWIKYLERKEGLTFKEALERLAKDAGVEINGQNKEKLEEETKRTNLLEESLNFFKEKLQTPEGKETLTYLKEVRRYSDTEIKDMELGLYPSIKELEDHLAGKGYLTDLIYNAGLKTMGYGDTHKLIIPYRDRVGRLKGFIARTLDDSIKPKYILSSGTDRGTLFNIHTTRGMKDIIVVEGFLDALVATQRGVSGVPPDHVAQRVVLVVERGHDEAPRHDRRQQCAEDCTSHDGNPEIDRRAGEGQ